MFQQMFRTGAEVQGQNIRAMQELFETFWPTPAKPESEPVPPAPPQAADVPTPSADGVPPRAAAKPRRGRQSED